MNFSVTTFFTLIVIVITAMCVLTDIKTGKIYNKITYPAVIAGSLLNLFLINADPLRGLKGCLGALFLFGLLRYAGCMAAGDVKLMAAIGAWQGLSFLLLASFHIICFAAVLGLGVLIWQGRLLSTLRWAGLSALTLLMPGAPIPSLAERRTTMPFAPAVFLGTVFTILQQEFHWPTVF